jgi:xylan 1,4-beta-xylosidase
MSYWTYSDLFEEPGPPTKPFEGGFGLMNPQGIRKPAWFAYKYLNQLGDKAVKVADTETYATIDHGGVQALVWAFRQPVQAVSNRPFYGKVQPTHDVEPISLDLKGLKPGAYTVQVFRTGFKANDAYTAYLEMGAPKTLSQQQTTALQALTTDKPETRALTIGKSGAASLPVTMRANDVVLVKVAPR